ncbi:MAG: hypothetical protein CMH70_06145 [Nitrosomonadaceae bacterium]|nr:hypothetical protein [Nitrosomonadaceae bacterium]|tara:strand:- start:30944 stop:31894 length:951 start_codon:yes stop_codon:yes gene_type:complete
MNSKIAAILGALIADSATLGLHWIYDPNRIAEIEKLKGLVFLQPDASHYEGVKGYFAHSAKNSGESTGYGEVCLLMLQHLVKYGEFRRTEYQTDFREHFGLGGTYVGYVDSPTRMTLQTLLPLEPKRFPKESGADDDQFLSLAGLPSVVAANTDNLEVLMSKIDEIVRVTNNNDLAVAAARCSGAVLFRILNGSSMEAALNGSLEFAGNKLRPLLEQVLAIQTLDNIKIAEKFGSACHVAEGLPVIFHIAKCIPDYQTAIEVNIRTGGDNCGRAIILGSILAAHMVQQKRSIFPIPLEWMIRYKRILDASDACLKL